MYTQWSGCSTLVSSLVYRVFKLLCSMRGDRWLGELRITFRDLVPNCNLLGLVHFRSKLMQNLIRWHLLSADNIIWHLAVRWWPRLHCSPGQLIWATNLRMLLANWNSILTIAWKFKTSIFVSFFFRLVFFVTCCCTVSRTIKLNYYNFKLICVHTTVDPVRIWRKCERSRRVKCINFEIIKLMWNIFRQSDFVRCVSLLCASQTAVWKRWKLLARR